MSIHWSDEGLVLSRARHGESGAVVRLFTRAHGLHAGLARGAGGRSGGALFQPGNRVSAAWRARLSEHLGTYRCELIEGLAARAMGDGDAIEALSAATALLSITLAESEAHEALYATTLDLLRRLGQGDWRAEYVRWEVALLGELGYGLDLSRCALTGDTTGLAYVSPLTGRAAGAAATAYADRLFTLPAFLVDASAAAPPQAVAAGLALTGHFIERQILLPHGKTMPAARLRLVERLGRSATIS